jgi:predicted RNA-binding protein YlqC (UPF0109 family)
MKNTNAVEQLDAFLRSLVKPMLGYPSKLVIDRSVMTEAVTLSLSASRSDTGRLIGDRGSVFRGLRTLVTAYGRNIGLRVHMLPIQEPVGGPDKGEREKQEAWDMNRLIKEVDSVALKVFRYPELVGVQGTNHGGTATNIEIRVSHQEQGNITDEIATALQDVFTAITKSHGRMVAVDVITMKEEKNRTKGTEYAKSQSKSAGP